eukprot:4032496-Amphidinium_carterae.1
MSHHVGLLVHTCVQRQGCANCQMRMLQRLSFLAVGGRWACDRDATHARNLASKSIMQTVAGLLAGMTGS